ncbi:MAG: hypothetical protein R6X25_09155 [Candidatus Krumholzibacteriia bacterium]
MKHGSRQQVSRRMVIVALALLLAPAFAAAHELTAPEVVVADGDGNFTFDVTLEVTAAAGDGAIDIETENTDLYQVHIDGFCLSTLEPGSQVHTVTGSLLNPAANGLIVYTRSLCDGFEATVSTLIQEPVVSTGRAGPCSWSVLKTVYR